MKNTISVALAGQEVLGDVIPRPPDELAAQPASRVLAASDVPRLRRRDALVGGITAGLWMAGCGESAPSPPPKTLPPRVDPVCAEIVESLIEAADPFEALSAWLSQGVAVEPLYAAALEVGARHIPPDGDLHDVLGVGAARVLSQQVTDEDPLIPLYRAWYEQHDVVQLSSGDVLPEIGTVEAADAVTLFAAWEDWDEDAAEAAIVALYREGGRDAVVGPLTRYGQRNHEWVGHTTIWTGHALRTLDAFGWHCAEPILRSLARAIAANEAKSRPDAFYANIDRLPAVSSALPAGWIGGEDEPERVPELMTVLRDGDAETCVNAVVDALQTGTSPRTLWTALDLVAVELSIRWQHASWGVHELDALNAFRHLAITTPDPQTALLTLLQAAAWRYEFQAFVTADPVVVEDTLDDFAPAGGSPPDLETVIELLGGDRVEAARALAAHFAGGGTADAVIARWPDVIVKHAGLDVHHQKYHAALVEEAQAALPEWREAMLIGIAMRNPSPVDAAWPRYQDAVDHIAALG